MKIALFHNYYNQPGGEDKVFESECRSLQALGHTVFPYVVKNDQQLSSPSLKEKIYTAIKGIYNKDQYDQIYRFLTKHRPAIGHVHNWFPIISPAIYQAHKDLGIPIVQTLHNYRLSCANGTFRREGENCELCITGNYRHAIYHKCYQSSRLGSLAWRNIVANKKNQLRFKQVVSGYIAPSQVVKNKFINIGLDNKKITIIPNGSPDLQQPTLLESTQPSFVFVGRFVPEKGVHVLINTWNKLFSEQKKNAPILHLIGDGPLRESLQISAQHNLSIVFHGQMTQELAYQKVNQCSALLFPSIWEEPFGLSIIEAMSCSKPVIANASGAPTEIIDHGKTGFLYKPANDIELINYIKILSSDSSLVKSMGEAGRCKYLSHYSEKAHAQKIVSYYEKILCQ